MITKEYIMALPSYIREETDRATRGSLAPIGYGTCPELEPYFCVDGLSVWMGQERGWEEHDQ